VTLCVSIVLPVARIFGTVRAALDSLRENVA